MLPGSVPSVTGQSPMTPGGATRAANTGLALERLAPWQGTRVPSLERRQMSPSRQ